MSFSVSGLHKKLFDVFCTFAFWYVFTLLHMNVSKNYDYYDSRKFEVSLVVCFP